MRGKKELVIFDTCVFGWAFRDALQDEDKNKRLSALNLVEKLQKEGADIVLPTIILFELLSVYGEEDEDDRIAFLNEVTKSFKIYDFGVQCANIASLIRNAKTKISNNKIFEGYTRSKLTIDLMILGTALSNNVRKIYTDNIKDFRKIERLIPDDYLNRIEIKELPEFMEQGTLFDD